MALRITFDLSDEDLDHFRLIMREARQAAAKLERDAIVDAARGLLREVRQADAPGFITERLGKLQTMIDMLEDQEWKLPAEETTRVLNALAYFGEPEDLIPDHIPGLGFLDDAIMVELVMRELRHEIQAYEDFCEFREQEEKRRRARGDDEQVTREEWLKSRRQELHSRMRRRRRSERSRRGGGGRSGGKSPFSLF